MSAPLDASTMPGAKFSIADIMRLQFSAKFLNGPDYDLLEFARTIMELHGEFARVAVGPIVFYQITGPEPAYQVLVTDASKYHKAQITKDTLGRLLGNGLLTSEGDFWKRQRKLAQPAFHAKRIEAYASTMVGYTQTMLDGWHDGDTRDIDQDMMKLTLNIVVKTLFGADLGDRVEAVGEIMPVALHTINQQINSAFKVPEWMPTPNKIAQQKSIKELDSILDEIIRERRQQREDNGDLLSMLMLAMDDEDGGQMTDKQLRDEAMTIFLAGHETTANALTWSLYLISQHPDVESRLHQELRQVLAGRAPTLGDLANLPYTDMVLKEAMRLYPPAAGAAREPIEDVVINGYLIPKGSLISIQTYAMHRNPRYFPNPAQFDPERFSKENEGQIPKYAYLPFGAGPRVCIGNMFALMEARLILATIAQRYQVALAPGQKVQAEQLVTVRPKYGMKMALKGRLPVPA